MIAGHAKGIRLKTPKGIKSRPTIDRVKESLFNIIAPYLYQCRVLDLFSGTGSLSIEALSRGAESAVLVDSDRNCCSIIRENLNRTGLLQKGTVYCKKVKTAIIDLGRKGDRFDIVFMDPPYLKNFVQETLQLIADNDIIMNDGIIIVEHHKKEPVPETIGYLKKTRIQTYGQTCITFICREEN